MNITFLIGNGFDLQLGLKTHYKDFLKWYIAQPTDDAEIASFKENIKDKKGEWWSDAELAMGQYVENYTDDSLSIYFKCIRDFKLKLWEYLKRENARYNLENNTDVVDAFKDFVLKSAEDIMLRPELLHLNSQRQKNNTSFHFVTFNYTDVLDRILDEVKIKYPFLESFSGHGFNYRTKIGNINHVHGTLKTSIIMGVDNLEQIKGNGITDFSKLSRTLLKPVVNEELGREEYEGAISTLLDSNYLFFYGLSFGETDKTWWDLIGERLIKNGNCQAVIFTRSSDDEIRTVIPEDILDYINDQKEHFLTKIGIPPRSEHYDTVRKRVFVIRNTKRLNISIEDKKVPLTV